MYLIFKLTILSSIAFVIILSIDAYDLKYIYSESFSSQQYSDYLNSKDSILNQTSLNSGCDFLNLCGNYAESKISAVNLPFNNKIVDVSYIDSNLKLPFP